MLASGGQSLVARKGNNLAQTCCLLPALWFLRWRLQRLLHGASRTGARFVDGDHPRCASCSFKLQLRRVIVPDLGAPVVADDERRGGCLAEGKAEVGTIDQLERAGTADVRRHLVVAFDDLGADNTTVFGDSPILA